VADPASLAFVEGSPVEPLAELPEPIAAAVQGATWSAVRGGVSDARVDLLRFADGTHRFLKSAVGDPSDPESPAGLLTAEHDNLRWLAERLPVADVVAFASSGAGTFLLTAAASGSPATDPDHHQDPDALVLALAAGLRRVHDLPIDGYAGAAGVAARVDRARLRVERGLVDRGDFEPAYARFTPERLLELLVDARPTAAEDLVVVHGDPTLSNLLLGAGDDGRLAVTGYLDVDRAGVADRYLDLAIVARSLATNLTPEALGPFFHAYGIEAPDLLKVDFYVLLDEFM
jgi:aminoglycoside phosphotransferase